MADYAQTLYLPYTFYAGLAQILSLMNISREIMLWNLGERSLPTKLSYAQVSVYLSPRGVQLRVQVSGVGFRHGATRISGMLYITQEVNVCFELARVSDPCVETIGTCLLLEALCVT